MNLSLVYKDFPITDGILRIYDDGLIALITKENTSTVFVNMYDFADKLYRALFHSGAYTVRDVHSTRKNQVILDIACYSDKVALIVTENSKDKSTTIQYHAQFSVMEELYSWLEL